MRGVAILGSTGSIGLSTLDVVARHPERYRVVALSAHRDVQGMLTQCRRFRPGLAAMADPAAATALAQAVAAEGLGVEVMAGAAGLEAVATHPDATDLMAAIVGAAGVLPTLAAVRLGRRILLANKEALVVSGALFMAAAQASGAQILPIDSEHNAVFQCLPPGFADGLDRVGVEQILLTASGGPFRNRPLAELQDVTPAQACAHPNWEMGRKISVDSATMMNKGLEVIEARWLFDARPDQIQVVVHPQSVIHSMVQYVDGSVLAQLGNPDMRTPIAHALAWPQRHSSGVAALNLFEIARLDFEPPDLARFPCLRLAFEAVTAGGTAPAVLNAANEVAVARFLSGDLAFTAIAEVVERTLDSVEHGAADSLDDLLAVDEHARGIAEQQLRRAV
ncbi:MAG: 1-deoxy-D-xylulose-5-phosphate reductoisomerase [Chromatiaceae bacterium]|nr:1-deoxy-D-xylulose-5-phosphate reductoisomerase [Gammaproteobacteria bacterium]MCP5318573.1 1-deoxy-D-xylulose-5-phosphate reductoisomerase [Chromatiaceae bacterium]MCP5435211.1 1-deoxy-D-xylulose-5-phosphate reductoisomerase [Chromatiaceae bacterium]MCW5586682.1 1-deoxy-D-xylulose-5-phosphate reductoisomerase [Chromatiales bacterium]HOP17887.1 1-deoxy-D-xylulose-5-phosphate reductoisomerase [Gammaproteobacteria bacterium]